MLGQRLGRYVIGVWASDRLIPDMMRSASKNERVIIRNSGATRPWPHVLEALSGSLLLGQKALEGRKEFADAWDFGPDNGAKVMVGKIAEQVKRLWPVSDFEIRNADGQPHEAGKLHLDCAKARNVLKWSPAWDGKTAVEKTVQWYRTFYESGTVHSRKDLQCYLADAENKHIAWTES